MSRTPSFVEWFMTNLTYILATDDTADAGGGSVHAGIDVLEQRLAFISQVRRQFGLDQRIWTSVHCVQDTNPLAYAPAQPDGLAAPTIADVATLWREYLHQGLYVPTVGSGGAEHRRAVLGALAATPRLVSQVHLVIDAAHRASAPRTYLVDLAEDLRVLLPLWSLPADRVDTDDHARRLQLVVVTSERHQPVARAAAGSVVQAAGLAANHVIEFIDDPRFVTFTTPGRARVAPHPHSGVRTGIRADGELFTLGDRTGTAEPLPYSLDQFRQVARRIGWAA